MSTCNAMYHMYHMYLDLVSLSNNLIAYVSSVHMYRRYSESLDVCFVRHRSAAIDDE